MKIRHEVLIAAPRERVWTIFDDADNLRKWQPTLQSFRRVGGEPGRIGSVSELRYVENGQEVVMTETVTDREAPELLAGSYESAFGMNHVENRFLAGDDFTTRWTMRCDFRFRDWKYRLFAPFIRPAIRRRIERDMERFRELAESAG